MRDIVMTDEHCRALDKIVLVARYLSLQSDIVQEHRIGEPFPFRAGELAAASKMLFEVEDLFSDLITELPTEEELARKQEEKKLPKSEKERRKKYGELLDQALRVTRFWEDNMDNLPAIAKLGRLLKADPDKVLAFIESAEEAGAEAQSLTRVPGHVQNYYCKDCLTEGEKERLPNIGKGGKGEKLVFSLEDGNPTGIWKNDQDEITCIRCGKSI